MAGESAGKSGVQARVLLLTFLGHCVFWWQPWALKGQQLSLTAS